MSKGVIGTLEIAFALFDPFPVSVFTNLAILAAGISTLHEQRAEISARNAYNASQRDRTQMIRSTVAPRQLVFGRCRVSGPMFFTSSYGTDRQHLVFCVALAAHEVDAIEDVWFDDKVVSLDGSGNVVGLRQHESFTISSSTFTISLQQTPQSGSVTATARYGDVITTLTVTGVTGVNVSVSGGDPTKTGQLDIYYQANPDPFAPTSRQQLQQTFTVVTGSDTFTLSATPDAVGVHAVYLASSSGANDNTPVTVVNVTGAAVQISGGTVGRQVVIYYETSSGLTRARVRKYLGAAGQVADVGMIAELPGVWTSAHTATGVAYLVVECDYDQTTFQGGIPNVSATVRGMKCYDPRSGTTAWTENPALHARALATHPLAGNLAATSIDDAAIAAAANVCDTTTGYVVGTATYTRALYTCGYAFSVDRKPTDGLAEIVQAMGGNWCFSDGMLRIAAGAYRTPNPGTLDETWLVDSAPVQVQAGVARSNLVNTITPKIFDRYQDFKQVPLPRISPTDYTTADNATLPQDLTLAAVTFSGQAQYIAACMLRQMRQGLTVTLRCNMRAWTAQRFDIVNVSLTRFGWVQKAFEVLADTWMEDGSIELVLRETSAVIWNLDAGYPDYDFAPNTNMPVPWGIPEIAGLTAQSDNTTYLYQSDGSIVPRMLVSWTAVTDSRVLQGGYIEIRYWLLGDVAANFATWKAQPTDTRAYIPGIRAGAQYMVTARACSVIAQSPWAPQTITNTGGKTSGPSSVTSAAYTLGSGRVHLTWAACPDLDYKLTEWRVGASWAAGTLIGQVAGTAIDWTPSGLATYTLWAANQNWSGVYGTAVSLSVVVDSSVNFGGSGGAIGGMTYYANAAVTPNTVTANAGIRFDSTGTVSRKQGNSTSAWTTIGRWISGTPAGTEQVQFSLVASNPTFGVPTLTGAGSMVALSGSPNVLAAATNQYGSFSLNYTLFDGSGNQIAPSGSIFLTVDSSN